MAPFTSGGIHHDLDHFGGLLSELLGAQNGGGRLYSREKPKMGDTFCVGVCPSFLDHHVYIANRDVLRGR